MKKTLTILILTVLLMSVWGCSGQKQVVKETEPPVENAVYREAALLPESEASSETETAGLMRAADYSVAVADETEEDHSGRDDENGVISYTMYFVDPDSSPYAEGGRKIAELVDEATNGRIQIKVEAGSEMGERELVEHAMDNQLDIATCANSVLTNYIPQMNILDQAYLWKNSEEAHAAVDGTLGDLIREKAEHLGLHVIGFEESGFRNTFSTKPIEKMEDFQGITIRTMENKYHQAAFEAFGAQPIGMPYPEVMGALEKGEINACENATVNCLNSGYYKVTKHVTNTRHAYVYILLLMSDEAWERIPDELMEPFMNAVTEGVAWERQRLVEAGAEATRQLEDLGVAFHEIDTGQLREAYEEIREKKGFIFDPEWTAAVEEAVREAASEEERSTETE